MATPLSGKTGTVKLGAVPTAVADITAWTLSLTSDNQAYNSSDTAGETKRIPGNADSTGTFEFYWDGAAEPVTKGELVDVELGFGTGNYEGNVIIDSVDPSMDVEGAAIMKVSVSFSQNGAMTFTAVT
jgi:hypothetical protein